MSDGALRISILGDASQFTKTLAKLEAELKGFKEKLKTATGADIPTYNLKIAGAQEAIKEITSFGKFAEGTLGALNQQISELNRKKLTIQADAAALAPINQELDRLIKKRDELNKAGLAKPIIESVRPAAESIAGLRLRIQELNDLKILIDPKLNPSALAKINQEIDILEDKVSNLDNLGNRIGGATGSAAGGLKKFEDQSRQSRIAVTNLALVLQDLPFGFIAIQNNLPNLQSSFANLKTTSDGTKDAFKAFAGALAGPGGFFLAFSAVTAAVTYAVQEYGSLGAAIDELFSKTSKFNAIYKRTTEGLAEYNKNLRTNEEIIGKAVGSQQGLISKISALSEVVLDVTQSENTRKKALQGLQEIDKERFKNFDIEKGKLQGLKGAVDALTQSILAKATAEAFGQQVGAAGVQFEQQKTATGVALQDLQEFEKKYPKARKSLEEYIKLNENAFEPAAPSGQVAELMNLELKLSEQQNSLKSIGDEWVRLNNLAKFYAKNASSLETIKPPDTGKLAKKVKEYREELEKVVPLFDMFQIKEKKTKQGLFFDFLEGLFSKNDLSQLKEAYKRIQDAQKEIDKFREGDRFSFLPNEAPKVRESNELIKNKERLARIVDQYKKTKSAVEEVFFNPLTDLFQNFFETGKLGFKQFADDALKQLQRILVSQITNKLISLLANTLVPGSGFIVQAGLKTIETSALADFLSNTPGSANFGGVVGAGMNMSGQVNVVLRGSDLIGAINRTNSTINRIG